MIWAKITYKQVSEMEIMSRKTIFDEEFYIEIVLLIIKRDGNKLMKLNFTFQQNYARPHTNRDHLKRGIFIYLA